MKREATGAIDATDLQEAWCLHRNGQTLGPFTVAELREGLTRNQWSWLDLAIQIGSSEWTVVSEIPGLRPLSLRNFSERQWIFERIFDRAEFSNDKNKREIFGPLTESEALRRLRAGELSYGDWAWSNGMECWVKAGEIEVFASSVERPTLKTFGVEAISPAEDLFASVKRLDEEKLDSQSLEQEVYPPDACGEDLVQGPEWMKYVGSCFTLTFVMAWILGLMFSVHARAASTLEIVPMKINTDQGFLVFQTEANLSQKISVSITGESGEILVLPSYYKTFEIERRAGEVPTLRLADLKLPKGRYEVLAKLGKLTAQTEIFIGVFDAEFSRDLQRHSKAIAHRQQGEKKTLFYTSRQLASMAERLTRKFKELRKNKIAWNKFYRLWVVDVRLTMKAFDETWNQSQPEGAVYPLKLQELKVLAGDLRDMGARFDRLVSGDRDLASANIDPERLPRDFRRIARQASILTSATDLTDRP